MNEQTMDRPTKQKEHGGMDANRFNAVTKMLAARLSRRAALHRGAIGLAATAALGAAARGARAQSATPGASPAAECPVTTEEENAAIARRWTEDMFTGRDLSVLDEIAAADIVWDAGNFPVLHGRKAVADAFNQLLAAFPDGRYTVDLVVTENNLVAVRWTLEGTHGGPLFGVSATGAHIEATGINIYQFRCGLIVAGVSEVDGEAIMRQMGVLPATPAATPIASPVASPGLVATPAASCTATSEDENEAMARRYLAVWSGGDVSGFAEMLAPDMVYHWGMGADTTDLAAFKHKVSQFFTAFPTYAVTPDEVLRQDDLVVLHWTAATGTQVGDLFDIPATQRPATLTGTTILRFACGQVVEAWAEADEVGMRQQLGVLPASVVMPAAGTPAA